MKLKNEVVAWNDFQDSSDSKILLVWMYTNKEILYLLGIREAGVIRVKWDWWRRSRNVCEKEMLIRGRVSCEQLCMSEAKKTQAQKKVERFVSD